jgi:hypothetical protein
MPSPPLQTSGGPAAERSSGRWIQSESGTRQLKWLFLVIAAAFCYLYISLFSLSGIPYFRTGDQGFYWTYACRLLSGEVFLRDFHQLTPPGTDLVYAAFFYWFGVSVRSINWIILWLGVNLAVVVYFCAQSIMRHSMAALAALLCLVVLYGDRMDATHHWFSSLANLLAVLVLFHNRNWPRIAAAAVFIAFAAFFTQTRGAVGLLACCAGLWWERRNGQISTRLLLLRLGLLFGITLAVWLLLSWRFIAQAGLANYWYSQVIYLSNDSNFPIGFLIPRFTWSFRFLSTIALFDHLAMYLLPLFVCPYVLILCERRRSEINQNSIALFLLASLGALQTLEIITMLNWNRMAATALPAMILAVWLIAQARPVRRAVVAASWSIVGAIILVESVAAQRHHYSLGDFPTGPALLQQDDAEEVLWVAGHTRRGDTFFEVANTRLYAPLALRNPTPVDLLIAQNFTRPSYVTEAVHGLDQSRTQYILWSQRAGIGSVERMHELPSDHLDPLRVYMLQAYVRIRVFANGDEIWERRN